MKNTVNDLTLKDLDLKLDPSLQRRLSKIKLENVIIQVDDLRKKTVGTAQLILKAICIELMLRDTS